MSDTSFLDFMAERAAMTAGADIQAVLSAGESELAASANEITLNMLRKAYAFGYAKGWADHAADDSEQTTQIVTLHPGDGVSGD